MTGADPTGGLFKPWEKEIDRLEKSVFSFEARRHECRLDMEGTRLERFLALTME